MYSKIIYGERIFGMRTNLTGLQCGAWSKGIDFNDWTLFWLRWYNLSHMERKECNETSYAMDIYRSASKHWQCETWLCLWNTALIINTHVYYKFDFSLQSKHSCISLFFLNRNSFVNVILFMTDQKNWNFIKQYSK